MSRHVEQHLDDDRNHFAKSSKAVCFDKIVQNFELLLHPTITTKSEFCDLKTLSSPSTFHSAFKADQSVSFVEYVYQ